MTTKKACIVVDLRDGQHITQIPNIVAVLAAAGWKTRIALKEYGGETIQLAQKAAEKGYDLVIGYGGDGTFNAVLNGVMYASNSDSTAADLPGGTFNVWAGALGIPNDPVKAALALVASEPHTIDLGHVEARGLLARSTQAPVLPDKETKRARESSETRQYFLLNVGLGMDAKMMNHISKPLKYRVGPLAFDVASAKELPSQRPFPVQLQQLDDKGKVTENWQGDVWQVYVSKVALFGGSLQIEQEARADDGILYVCLITANGPIKTLEQVFSVLTQHKLDDETTRYFRGTHFSLRVPTSVEMHVDGSISRAEEFLHQAERMQLEQATDRSQFLVDYHFDLIPKALRIAVPHSYDGPLFKGADKKERHANSGLQKMEEAHPAEDQDVNDQEQTLQGRKDQHKIKFIGAISTLEKHALIIVAGSFKHQNTDETQVVALQVTAKTPVCNQAGEPIAPAALLELQEGQELIVTGSKNKRGVIQAEEIRLQEEVKGQ